MFVFAYLTSSFGKIARWVMYIQELDLVKKHKSGKHNTNADALSRNQRSETARESTQSAECFAEITELTSNPSRVTSPYLNQEMLEVRR